MNKVKDFNKIKDYLDSVKLNLDQKLPDFMIYDFDELAEDVEMEIKGYRHHFFEITLEITNGCRFNVDNFKFPSEGSRISFISPRRLQSVHVHPEFSSTSKGFTLFFNPEFIHTHFASNNLLKDFSFFRHSLSPMVRLENKLLAELTDVFQKIHYEYNEYGTQSRDIIKSYLDIILHKGRHHYTWTQPLDLANCRELEIASSFEVFCQENYLDYHTVKEIALEIGLSAKHLSETIKKVTGKKALEILNEYKLNYAKALLSHTQLTPTQVAYELNFENPGYFFTFFKRLTGLTPVQFRQF